MADFEAIEAKYEPKCTVCRNPRRAEIEHAIASGEPQRDVAKRFKLSKDAVNRHWLHHVSSFMKQARKLEILKPGARLDELIVEEGRGLLDNLQIIRGKLYRQLEIAIAGDDRPGVTSVTRELHRNLELSAKSTGELQNARPNVTNIVLSQDYVELRHNILKALRPFPEASAAVIAALRDVERTVDLTPMIDAKTSEVLHG